MAISSGEPNRWNSDPWSRYSVLSLDGSGLRVLSELLILERLMQKIVSIEREVAKPYAETSADSRLVERNQIVLEFEKLRAARGQIPHEHRVAETINSRYLPCHYFDFIVGTSTGGLVALMLGELRMSIETALSFYLDIMPQLYRLHYESRLRKILSIRRSNPQSKLFRSIDMLGTSPISSDKSRCKTVVCSFTESDNGQVIPFLFRSYRKLESDQADLTVSAIAKAGCCHPYKFKPVKLGTYSYYDTGFIFTNPSSIIIDELHQFHPADKSSNSNSGRRSAPASIETSKKLENGRNEPSLSSAVTSDHRTTPKQKGEEISQVGAVKPDPRNPKMVHFEDGHSNHENHTPISLLLSLGSGYDQGKEFNKGSSTRARLNRILQATAEPVHKEVYRRSRIDTQLFSYIRLNANLKLSKKVIGYSSKNEAQKLGKEIRTRTAAFLSNPETEKELDEAASELVALRRQRCQTRAWEAFAFGWRYQCVQCKRENKDRGVDKPVDIFHSAADLIDHFLRQHESWKVGTEFNDELQMLTTESRTSSDELRKVKEEKLSTT